MRRLASLLMLACAAGAVLSSGNTVQAAGTSATTASAAKSHFPGGLSPQWLNAADVEPTACLAKLAASGAKYTVLPPQVKPNAKGCGVPHGVMVTRGPTGITYSPPLWVDCSFATLLEPIESIIQDEARSDLLNVAMRLKRESGLTHVLTPDFNADHRNHFHLDRGLPFGWWWDDQVAATPGNP